MTGRIPTMSLTSLTIVAAEASHGDPALSPYAVGAMLLMFGAGREHS
jgi:hypothetical protein